MTYKIIKCLFFVCVFCCGYPVKAQKNDAPALVHNALMVGVGKSYEYDTYLSPLEYSGFGVNLHTEWMHAIGKPSKKLSVYHSFEARFSKTTNPSKTANYLSGGIRYTLGYHYRFTPLPRLTLFAGGSFSPYIGGIYNDRNVNNPANANVSLNLNLSGIALYQLNVRNYPISLKAQVDIPFLGTLFSPHYGQSYYEIFGLKDYKGIVHFASFHNQRACKALITADLPLGNMTLRIGYYGDFYRRDVSNLTAYSVYNGFMIGFARDVLSFGGKRIKQLSKPNSFYLWEE
ncbi:MAG: DUF3316 domain-containing protein [Bacteroidales bacterium]|nr:DUF3316 domain-containing protein [Bacteroidales bacterium]